jgi:hypothetical protein
MYLIFLFFMRLNCLYITPPQKKKPIYYQFYAVSDVYNSYNRCVLSVSWMTEGNHDLCSAVTELNVRWS